MRRLELLKLLRQAPAITDVAWIDADGLEQVQVSRLTLNRLRHALPRHDDPAFTGTTGGRTWRGAVSFRTGSEPYLRVARRASAGGGVTALAKAPGVESGHNADAVDTAGKPVLAAAARIDRLGWTVIVESPRSEALAPVLRSAWRLAAGVVAGLMLSVLASVLLARILARPIRALQDGADRIGAGDLEHRIAVTTHAEVQALAARFNQMASNLQASVGELEQRVAARTHELAAAYEAKSHFIAAASHGLRQPVHALGQFVGQRCAKPGCRCWSNRCRRHACAHSLNRC